MWFYNSAIKHHVRYKGSWLTPGPWLIARKGLLRLRFLLLASYVALSWFDSPQFNNSNKN